MVPIIGKFRECIEIGGMKMDESDFYVLQGTSDKYGLLLGYKFLKESIMIIHPENEMMERRLEQGGRCM